MEDADVKDSVKMACCAHACMDMPRHFHVAFDVRVLHLNLSIESVWDILEGRADPAIPIFPWHWFIRSVCLHVGFFPNSYLNTRWLIMVLEDTTIVTRTVTKLTRKRDVVFWMIMKRLIAAFAGMIKYSRKSFTSRQFRKI